MTSEQEAEAKRWIARLADHLECAADIIREDCVGVDEEDDADEREFVADARAFLVSLAAPPAGVGAEACVCRYGKLPCGDFPELGHATQPPVETKGP